MVEALGFEPREVLPSPVFKTGAFDQLSQTSAKRCKSLIDGMEVPPGFEPGVAALQAAALPLGDGTTSE